MKKIMLLLLIMGTLLAVSSCASRTGTTPDVSVESRIDKAGNDPGMNNMASNYEVVTLELTAAGPNKIKVIRAVREVTPLELKKAKELVESAPAILIEKISRAEAEKIKEKFEKLGAKVTIKKI